MIPNSSEFSLSEDTPKKFFSSLVKEIDPVRDMAILKADITFNGRIPRIGSFDDDKVGDEVGIFGYPHCVEGRRALTFQKAELGAKVLLKEAAEKVLFPAPRERVRV